MSSTDALLSTARGIAAAIERDAVWVADRCNWIGADVDGPAPGAEEPGEVYRALDCSLYGGSAGVGLFLAELSAETGDRGAGRTARGALQHALGAADPAAPGLYTGALGVALAAARTGLRLGDSELVDRAAGLARALAARSDADGESDLLHGAAGMVIGLLTLARLLGAPDLLDAARAAGDALMARAEPGGGGLSWPAPSEPRARHLTGLSHGAAGCGLALLELHAATGDPRCAEVAHAAFAYERALFDPSARNWPDLRNDHRNPGFATFWCHGAPGIALSRLRAIELGAVEAAMHEAEIASSTTVSALARDVTRERAGFSLCHGLAGNAEVAREAGRAGVAGKVAEAGMRAYAANGDWPCGMLGGTPARGLVGGGGTAHCPGGGAPPSVPSVLLIRPDAWAPCRPGGTT